MACRICFEDCTTALPCGCVGYVHFKCLEAWIASRLARGDLIEDALHCEVCTGKYLGARARKCSDARMLTLRVCVGACIAVLACTLIAFILNWANNSHDEPLVINTLMMMGVWGLILGIVFVASSLIIRRVMSADCINACTIPRIYIESDV